MNRVLIPLAASLDPVLPLLIGSALKGATLLALAAVAALGLRKASAATRHLVWLFAMAALIVLPLLSALLPGWRILPPWTAMAMPAAPIPTTNESPTPTLRTTVAASSPTAVSPIRGSTTPASGVPVEPSSISVWLTFAWAAGFISLGVRLLAAQWQLSRATRGCAAAVDSQLAEAMTQARRQLGVRQSVQVLLDPRRTIPIVWGVFRTRLLLPVEALEWSKGQLHSVLLHELAHVKRRDLAVQWLKQIACALHWFNPLVWFAAWRLHVEGERACDNLVLASGVRASEYAEHLLDVATKLNPSSVAHVCALAMAWPSRLEGRLTAVLNERLNRRAITRSLALVALGLGLCMIIPVAMLRVRAESATAKDPTQSVADVVTVQIADAGAVSLLGKAVALDALGTQLAPLQRANSNVLFAIRASPGTAFTNIVNLLRKLEQAGVTSVSFFTHKGELTEAGPVRFRQAARELERFSELHGRGLMAVEEYDKAKAKLDLLRAELLGGASEIALHKLRVAEKELAHASALRRDGLIGEEQYNKAKDDIELLQAELRDDKRIQVQRAAEALKLQSELRRKNLVK